MNTHTHALVADTHLHPVTLPLSLLLVRHLLLLRSLDASSIAARVLPHPLAEVTPRGSGEVAGWREETGNYLPVEDHITWSTTNS